MGVCDWFKRIRRKREKEKTTIMLKDFIDSRGTKNVYSMENEFGFCVTGRSKELAAARIQSAFRVYKARKMLRYLRGISRRKDKLTKQASNALDSLHFWSKIHAEISNRRRSEGGIKQLNLEDLLKDNSKFHEVETGPTKQMEWCGGPKTMLENAFKMQQREIAANKRERTLSYAFSHQWRAKSSRYFGQAYYDLSEESWGWKWTEAWIPVYRLEAHVVVRPVISQRTRKRKKPSERKKMVVGVKRI